MSRTNMDSVGLARYAGLPSRSRWMPPCTSRVPRPLTLGRTDVGLQEVRDYVSRRYGRPIDFVAAASLDHLDEHGGVVSWVGVDGGHYSRIAFSREARCPHSLALALRGELNGP